MPITLPDSFRPRIEPLARVAGRSVDDFVVDVMEDWLSWKEAEPLIEEALKGPPAEPLAEDEFESVRRMILRRRCSAMANSEDQSDGESCS